MWKVFKDISLDVYYEGKLKSISSELSIWALKPENSGELSQVFFCISNWSVVDILTYRDVIIVDCPLCINLLSNPAVYGPLQKASS